MTDKEFSFIVENIAKKTRVSMDNVSSVLKSYFEMVELGRCSLDTAEGIAWGAISLDQTLKLHKGMTMISGHESCGKTSLAKRIAYSARAQGLTVAYYDSDNKLFLHDLEPLMNLGIVFANSYRDSGLTEIIRSGLIDVLIIDGITSLHMTSQHSFLTKLRKFVPYIIFTSQTRSEWGTGKAVAACDERILSMANCEIFLSSKEQITVESEDLSRVQFKVMKNEADRSKERSHGSFILKDNIVDTTYSAFDVLRTRGRVRSVGEVKYLDKTDIGKIKNLSKPENKTKKDLLIKTALEELNMDWSTYERVYTGSNIHRPMRNVQPLQIENSSEGETDKATSA